MLIETVKEKHDRIFNHYKNMMANKCRNANENIQFNVIEYLCSFPKIDPFMMAAELIKDGLTIVYDDSSITKAENKAKENRVKRLLRKGGLHNERKI